MVLLRSQGELCEGRLLNLWYELQIKVKTMLYFMSSVVDCLHHEYKFICSKTKSSVKHLVRHLLPVQPPQQPNPRRLISRERKEKLMSCSRELYLMMWSMALQVCFKPSWNKDESWWEFANSHSRLAWNSDFECAQIFHESQWQFSLVWR